MAKKKIFMSATASAVIASTLLHAQSVDAASYTVKPGDTLWAISQQHQASVSQIKSWNNLSSDVIFPNQVLTINPTSSSTKTTTPKSTANKATNNDSNSKASTYTVVRGDSLSKIAAQHGISLSNLMKWNNLSTTLIFPGDKLNVSKPSSSSSNSSTSKSNSSQQTSTSTNQSNKSSQATYTVKSGDTLSKIASQHGISLANLKKWNSLSSDLIYPGDRLVVSNQSSNSSSQQNSNNSSNSSTTKNNSNSSQSSSQTYTVKSGDNLSKIAAAHGISLSQLKSLNNITSHIIYPGDVLIVNENAQKNSSNNSNSNSSAAKSEPSNGNVSSLINKAKSALGVSYTWGGSSLSGFDCSGFIYWAFKETGQNIGRYSTEGYYNRSFIVNQPQVGDLVFFENTYKSGISHMGIYLGNNEFIHAGSSTGVTIANLNSSYWKEHFHSFKRFY